jgi:tetratricopeptide (TPR) repeat protein
MVRLCLAGGRLTEKPEVREQLETAAQLHASGKLAEAAALYREILNASPRETEALHMLGVIAQQGGNPALALKFLEAALAADSNFTRAWYNRGLVLHVLKNDQKALQSLQMAVELDPGLGAAWDMIGQLLKNQGAYSEAQLCHTRAILLQPHNPRFYDNYADLLLARGDYTKACDTARHAETLDPSYISMSLGSILKAMGYPEQAASQFARLRALRGDDAETTATEAMVRLQIGDMEQGWKLWEQRPFLEKSLDTIPLWQGQEVTRLLLYEDQGLGDALQFLRYIPLLKSRAVQIVLCVRVPLRHLCAENFPNLKVMPFDSLPQTLPALKQEGLIDARCRLSSLPFHFAARLGNIPSAPYLVAPAGRRGFWREALQDMPAPRIGLVWAGGAKFRRDAERSLNAATLYPLVACGAKHFVSLQKDRRDKIAEILDAAPRLQDFADTAALVAELDLVITVDTAVAHLAGALGKPAWILLPFDSDWRWLLGREDSPWYPSARLFRQKTPGDWPQVIARVKAEIEKLIAGDRTVLQAKPWNGESLRQNPDALPLAL